MLQEKYEDAVNTIETSLEIIDCIFKDDEITPPIHYRDRDDLYMIIAEIYLKNNKTEKAIFYLEKMVDYDLNNYTKIDGNMQTASPLLNSIPHDLYKKRIDRYQKLATKLTDPRFESLKTNERYQKLINSVNE